jgi:DNA modification methylase
MLAGNGVVEAAAAAGITKVRIIEATGEEIIAVRRRGLTPAQKRALAIYDNRTAELATWNFAQLAEDQANGLDLAAFWRQDELAAMLTKTAKAGLTDPDATPAPRATSIKVGDLFELGQHRLICGDSTDAPTIARLLNGAAPALMVTDPPYGVKYDPTWRAKAGINRNKKKMGVVTNDDRADWSDAWRLFPGAVAYVWHAALKNTVQTSLEATGFTMRAQIIWAKDRLVLSRGDYHWQHEPCWYAVRTGAGKTFRTEDRTQTSVWEIPSTLWRIPGRDDEGHGHSTQKPVECMARALRNHNALEVYEPFLGSGTTMIAAEQLARRCYACELAPTYVQIAIDRWEAFTGRKAKKIGSGSTAAARTARRGRTK